MNVFIVISALLSGIYVADANLNGHFLMFCDVHVDPWYNDTLESCNEGVTKEDLGPYGNYECDPPYKLVENAFATLNDMAETNNVDFIVWMGDTPGHMNRQLDWTKETFLQAMKNSTDILVQHITNKKVIPVLGNHDYFPRNQLPASNSEIYDAIAEMWKPWLDGDALDSFKNGGFYTIPLSETAPKLRAIVLNTNLASRSNDETHGAADPGNQFQWLETQLQNAVDNDEKIRLFFHIPPGSRDAESGTFSLRKNQNDMLNSIIRKYSSGDNAVIVDVHAAHFHRDSFKMFYENGTDTPVATMFGSPSVTPWRFFGSSSSVPRNPAMRMFDFDTQQLHLTDVKSYYLELPKANDGSDTTWKLEYSYKDAYGLADATPASLHQLLSKLKVDDSSEFGKYVKYNTVSMKPEDSEFYDGVCDCQCKAKLLCAIEFVDVDPYTQCIEENMPETCDGATTVQVMIPLIILMLMLLHAIERLR